MAIMDMMSLRHWRVMATGTQYVVIGCCFVVHVGGDAGFGENGMRLSSLLVSWPLLSHATLLLLRRIMSHYVIHASDGTALFTWRSAEDGTRGLLKY